MEYILVKTEIPTYMRHLQGFFVTTRDHWNKLMEFYDKALLEKEGYRLTEYFIQGDDFSTVDDIDKYKEFVEITKLSKEQYHFIKEVFGVSYGEFAHPAEFINKGGMLLLDTIEYRELLKQT